MESQTLSANSVSENPGTDSLLDLGLGLPLNTLLTGQVDFYAERRAESASPVSMGGAML